MRDAQFKRAKNGDLLSDQKCVRYEHCKTREPYFGFVPLKRKIAAESRGKEANYCSDTCRHTFNVAKWRSGKSSTARKPRAKKKRKGAAA